MIAIIFLCIINYHLFATFMWNFTTTSLCIAEILFFFIKKMAENCRLQHCQLTHAYWRDVNHLMERLGLHQLCGSKSVAHSSASLNAYWWRAL